MYTLKYNLTEYPTETYYITKYVHDHEETDPKIIGAMVELLVNGYLQNASEKNINECFQLLKTTKEANINWNDSNEINELIEQHF